MNPFLRLREWVDEPVPVIRLALVRILVPLFVLGFMSGRLVHADAWIGDHGFHPPDLGGDWRQPMYIPPLASPFAWGVAWAMIVSGLMLAIGWRTRGAGFVFALTLAFVALADRLAAFTVSKMSPAIVLAITLGPSGSRLGVDALLRARRVGKVPKKIRPAGSLRFLQLLPVFIYSASGIAKARGDWLTTAYVLWSQLHDSYQTVVSFWLASHLPAWSWPPMQGAVLLFEMGAPIWFSMRKTHRLATIFGLGMHAMIGLMFGPVVWFALLMMSLLFAGHGDDSWLAPVERLASSLERMAARRRKAKEALA